MKGFKTFAFGILIAVTAALVSPDVQQFVAENLPVVGGLLGTIIVILRALTSSPIFKGETGAGDKKAGGDA